MNRFRRIYSKNSPKQKTFIVEKSPFSAEQNGKIIFAYFVYEIHGIKYMHVQKPL